MKLIDDFVYRKSILKECDKLKKELEEAIENEDHEVVLAIRNQLSAFKLAIRLLDIQPTAYDIDKVVEELKTTRTDYAGDFQDDIAYGLKLAIEIVNQDYKNTV